jgi:hypothetical protein
MLFQFPSAIQAGIEAGKYLQVFSSSGVPLSIARDATTGQFVGHAVGVLNNGLALNPLTVAPQLLMGAGQLYQNHLGLQALQSLTASVATLQATTMVIGVGTVVTAALGAVNLWQTLKLRQDIKQLRLDVKEGFIDLRQALQAQGHEIIQHIDRVAEDIEFRNHRTVLARAYGLFAKATARLQSATALLDLSLRNNEITAARDMLFQALADYDNEQLLVGVCSAGQIRRRECVWAIEQTITMTYELQGEYHVASDRLSALDTTIRRDALKAIDACDSQAELDFLFPEITRIHDHDLATIDAWKNHIDFYKALPPAELKLLNSQMSDSTSLPVTSTDNGVAPILMIPPEQALYEDLQQKSHYAALRDQLMFLIAPTLRQEYETYVSEQAAIAGFKALSPSNLQKSSHLALANLFSYFQLRDESQEELRDEAPDDLRAQPA